MKQKVISIVILFVLIVAIIAFRIFYYRSDIFLQSKITSTTTTTTQTSLATSSITSSASTCAAPTDFAVSINNISAKATTFMITGIANIGSNTEYNAFLEIPQQNNFAVNGTNTLFLGSLGPGDSLGQDVFSNMQIYQKSPVTSNESLLVYISYSDSTGLKCLWQKEIILQVS